MFIYCLKVLFLLSFVKLNVTSYILWLATGQIQIKGNPILNKRKKQKEKRLADFPFIPQQFIKYNTVMLLLRKNKMLLVLYSFCSYLYHMQYLGLCSLIRKRMDERAYACIANFFQIVLQITEK